MDPDTLRSIERIIAVVIGGLAIYLGYRLFLALPERHDSEGRFVFPGNISVYMSRVGPGVFFALFGAAVIALALFRGISFTETSYFGLPSPSSPTPLTSPIEEKVTKDFIGVAGEKSEAQARDLETQREVIKQDIGVLNTVPHQLNPDLGGSSRSDVKLAIPRIKRVIMSTVWDQESWGEFAVFEDWIRDGEPDPPPRTIEEAVNFYKFGQTREP